MTEYLSVFIYLILSIIISLIIIIVNWIVSPRRVDIEKASAYECGFDPFGEARSPFEVSFYLVAILFIIFDIEVAYLFPWAVGLTIVGWTGFWTMFFFLWILIVGFYYEWKKGALDWN
nr:NADH dehydrogenase subunit 3 [Oedogonium sp. 244]